MITLDDYIFWQSSEIYLESMENFVTRKLTGSDFVDRIYYLLLGNKIECKILQFSRVLLKLEDALAAFSAEPSPEPAYLNEDQLREIMKDHLPKVKKYFINEI